MAQRKCEGVDFFTIDYRGAQFHFPDRMTHIESEIRRLGTFYEIDLLEHLATVVRPGGLWIDVGANIGNHSIYFAKYLADRVWSVEAHPGNFAVLSETLRTNLIHNVTTTNVALGSASAVGYLSCPAGFENNPGSFTLQAESDGIPVEVQPLDAMLASLPAVNSLPVRVLKVDVEGAEISVLDGAREMILRDRPHIVVEAQSDERLRDVTERLPGYVNVARLCATPTYHFAPWSTLRFLAFRGRRKLRHVLGIR